MTRTVSQDIGTCLYNIIFCLIPNDALEAKRMNPNPHPWPFPNCQLRPPPQSYQRSEVNDVTIPTVTSLLNARKAGRHQRRVTRSWRGHRIILPQAQPSLMKPHHIIPMAFLPRHVYIRLLQQGSTPLRLARYPTTGSHPPIPPTPQVTLPQPILQHLRSIPLRCNLSTRRGRLQDTMLLWE